MIAYKKYITQALKLAAKGGRAVAPNPMVGAIIVKAGHVIGKGYHQKFGGPHAEVQAIKSVKRKADLIGATIYVTLEPCRHHGKTPPCQGFIESVGIARVVCGSRDPFQHGCRPKNMQFISGPLAKKCTELNKFFFTWIKKQRPYITVKIAVSADGFVAGPNGQPVHITSAKQDKMVHQLRADHQAIMVGSGTVLNDDPHLGVRLVKGSDPLRIILDRKNKIPKSAKVFRNKNYLHINKPTTLKKVLRHLAGNGVASILIEPGPTLYKSLKQQGIIDELIILRGKIKMNEGLAIKI